ncbi:hypothetical protein F5Y18DRAFT_409614 [Xylariaceae sp. FL1019]|nr:hypothetical protein F5Y18DRAFT_409614 [Xylariaceae sp. FL1019]
MSALTASANTPPLPRQRATRACETCRSRRTKCDGRKPTCLFCEQHDIVCTYRAPEPPASRQEIELAAIRERLDHIDGLLSLRTGTGQSGTTLVPPSVDTNKNLNPSELPKQLSEYPADESIISRNWRKEFPFMTIQTPRMMGLLGLDSRLAARLVVLERTDVSTLTGPASPAAAPRFIFEYHDAVRAFAAFCDKIHHWYPILSQQFSEMYHEEIVGGRDPSLDTFLALLVAAIGSVVRCPTIAEAYLTRPDSVYIGHALSMLPIVHFEFSLRSVQCLVLLSLYYNIMVKPCQAHDYILMASCRAQALFKCHLCDEDRATMELLRRCFWSILLIESELAYHIDMPESNIWKFDDRILLPETFDSWLPFREERRHMGEDLCPPNETGMPPEAGKAYFLAEITMWRMVRRCTTSLIITREREVYAPIIAAELAHQLEIWYSHLPPRLRFERQLTTIGLSEDRDCRPLSAATYFLQMQFFLCLASIYWPAVYGVIYMDTLTDAPVADCARFFDSYCNFVTSAVAALPCCPQSTWYIYASLFITTMAALRGARAPLLRHSISSDLIQCIVNATKAFEDGLAVTVSPSLRTIAAILRDQVDSQLESDIC